jgi:hypothetical protein
VADQGYSRRELLAALWVLSAVGLFWCLSAIVLAALAYRRVNAARIALVVSCGCTVVVGVGTLVGVLHAVAAASCGVLLLLGTTRRWFDGHPDGSLPGGPQGPSSWGPPPSQQPSQQQSQPPAPGEQPPGDGRPPVW